MHMFIIQRITTEWTKSSRGGDGAARRNAVPEAVALPDLDLDRGDAKYILHDIHYRERDEFRPDELLTEAMATDFLSDVAPLFINLSRNRIKVRFVWSWNGCGAPERASRTLFSLSMGQWGRFICNGRFGAQSSSGDQWRYHKTVFNVAFMKLSSPSIFSSSTPAANDQEMAILR